MKNAATSRKEAEPAQPQTRSGILMQLRSLHRDLPPTAARIAVFVAENGEEVIRMSITELAEQVNASEGSIVGLCRRLGISGFQELKILIARDLVEPFQFIQEDLEEGDDFDKACDRVFAAHAASLAETRKLLSLSSLTEAVSIIRSAQRILVFGIGSSAPVAEDLAYRLMQLGFAAHPVVDSHIQAVAGAMASPDVAAITVSHSGSTVETVMATRLAKEAGAKTVGITRFGKSPLLRHCDVVLHTVSRETRFRPEAMSSRMAQLAIVDTLVSCCALANPQESIPRLQLSARVISEKRY